MLCLSVVAVGEGAHAYIAFEVFPEERYVGEVERVGDILDGEVGGFELRFGIHDNHA